MAQAIKQFFAHLAEQTMQEVDLAYTVLDSVVDRVQADNIKNGETLRQKMAGPEMHHAMRDIMRNLPHARSGEGSDAAVFDA